MPDTELALLMDRFVRRIHFGLQAKAHAFDKDKIGPSGGIVLMTLAEMGSPGLNELTTRVARDKSQMTRTIRTLEDKGLVSRRTSPEDARVNLVCLTEKGTEVVKELQLAVAGIIGDILAPLPSHDETVLKDMLMRTLSDSDPAE